MDYDLVCSEVNCRRLSLPEEIWGDVTNFFRYYTNSYRKDGEYRHIGEGWFMTYYHEEFENWISEIPDIEIFPMMTPDADYIWLPISMKFIYIPNKDDEQLTRIRWC